MKAYYRLVKPGIVYGNAMTALAAFVFASHQHFSALPLVLMLVGIMCSIASACVINNILDRDIDAKMERTKERSIPMGEISIRHALLFAIALGAIGIVALLCVNLKALAITLIGAIVYVSFYTPLKRVSQHSTIVGAIAGAVPPVVGYVAVTDALDAIALLLFLILVCWQMVHFLAIAIFREDEYRAAELPVMPVRFSVLRTKALMIVYALLFAGALAALYFVAQLGLLYATVLGALSCGWIALSLFGLRASDGRGWAKRMFFYSIVVLLAFCIVLALS